MGVGVEKFGIRDDFIRPPQRGRNTNVAVSVLSAMAEYKACLRAQCVSRSSYTGWQTEKPENLDKKALGMSPKILLRRSLLQKLRYLGLWLDTGHSFFDN